MIITDEALLRVKCEPVLSDEVNDLRLKLEIALDWSENQGRKGVGLACPQIGIAKRMAIVRIDDTKIDLVNANVKKGYRQFEFEGEGCLSFPDLVVNSLRYMEVLIEDNLVYPNRFIATGFIAIAIQHEIDHLNSVLLPDVRIKK